MMMVVLVEQSPDEHLRNNVAFKFIQPIVDFAVVQLFIALADALEHQRLWLKRRVNSKNIEGDARC